MDFEDWLAAQIEAAGPDWHYMILWDRQPADFRCFKHDFPDDETARERLAVRERLDHELRFIAYECS